MLVQGVARLFSILAIGGLLIVGLAFIAIGTGIVEDVIRSLLRDMVGF